MTTYKDLLNAIDEVRSKDFKVRRIEIGEGAFYDVFHNYAHPAVRHCLEGYTVGGIEIEIIEGDSVYVVYNTHSSFVKRIEVTSDRCEHDDVFGENDGGQRVCMDCGEEL